MDHQVASGAPVNGMGDGARRRVLVIDDHVPSAVALARLLGVLGHEASIAHDGVEALAAVQGDARTPDLILLDIAMPRMSGFTVARRLRANRRLDGATLVALTGGDATTDRVRAYDAGFDHYLPKPVAVDALMALLDSPDGPIVHA